MVGRARLAGRPGRRHRCGRARALGPRRVRGCPGVTRRRLGLARDPRRGNRLGRRGRLDVYAARRLNARLLAVPTAVDSGAQGVRWDLTPLAPSEEAMKDRLDAAV